MEEEVNRCCSSCYDKIADLLVDTDNDGEGNSNEGILISTAGLCVQVLLED